MDKNILRIGTRGSPLALWQAHYVKDRLHRERPGLKIEIEVITTSGDKIKNRPLLEVGGKGLFVKEIQTALLDGKVDIAVHSLKDYPAENPPSLQLACVPAREDRRDALVWAADWCGPTLPAGAIVATGSLRRQHQLSLIHPEWNIMGLRGNVDTRLKKVDSGAVDGVILAAAGLRRLGYEQRISMSFPIEDMVPAAGQGALAIEGRCDEPDVAALLMEIQDHRSRIEVDIEREFLKKIGASCTTPLGVTALLEGDGGVILLGFLSSIDGKRHVKGRVEGGADDPAALVDGLMRQFLEQGASSMLGAGP